MRNVCRVEICADAAACLCPALFCLLCNIRNKVVLYLKYAVLSRCPEYIGVPTREVALYPQVAGRHGTREAVTSRRLVSVVHQGWG